MEIIEIIGPYLEIIDRVKVFKFLYLKHHEYYRQKTVNCMQHIQTVGMKINDEICDKLQQMVDK